MCAVMDWQPVWGVFPGFNPVCAADRLQQMPAALIRYKAGKIME